MTTILDSINNKPSVKAPEAVTAATNTSNDVASESSENNDFSKLIKQSQSSEINSETKKNTDKSSTKELDTVQDDKQSVALEASGVLNVIQNNDASPLLSLINSELSETDNSISRSVNTTAENAENSHQTLDLELPAVNVSGKPPILNTEISGKTLPIEGQIQPTPLVAKAFDKILAVKDNQQHLTAEPKLVVAQPKQAGIDLKLVAAATTVANISQPQAQVQTILQPNLIQNKSLEITKADQDVGTRLLNVSEAQLLNQNIKTPEQLKMTQLNIQNTPQQDLKSAALSTTQPEVNLEKWLSGEVKLQKGQQISDLLNTDKISDIRTTNTPQQNQTQPLTSLLPSHLNGSLTSTNSDPKVTTLMMQTPYTAGNKEWSESFAKNIALMTVSKNNLAEIRMDPPDLGSIQVKISQTSTETNLQFHIQHNDTRVAIESSIQRLKESLAEHGFANVNVDIQQRENSQNQSDDNPQQLQNAAVNPEIGVYPEQVSALQLQPIVQSGVDFFA